MVQVPSVGLILYDHRPFAKQPVRVVPSTFILEPCVSSITLVRQRWGYACCRGLSRDEATMQRRCCTCGGKPTNHHNNAAFPHIEVLILCKVMGYAADMPDLFFFVHFVFAQGQTVKLSSEFEIHVRPAHMRMHQIRRSY